MKVIKEQLLVEAPRDGAVDFKLPKDMLNNPSSINLRGMAAQAKADADAKMNFWIRTDAITSVTLYNESAWAALKA